MHVVIGGNTPMHPVYRQCFVLQLWFDESTPTVELLFKTEEEVIKVQQWLDHICVLENENRDEERNSFIRHAPVYGWIGWAWPYSEITTGLQHLETKRWLWYNDAGVAHEVSFGVT